MTGGRSAMRRFERPNSSRYLTFSCYRGLSLLGSPAIRDAFALALLKARNKTRFELYGWVAMPNHVHLLLMPDLPACPVPLVLCDLKRDFARTVLQRWRRLRAGVLVHLADSNGRLRFWQKGGGYDRIIRSRDDFFEKLAYMHQNPVRAGLVMREGDWRWSSARWYAGDRSETVVIDPHRW